MKQQWGITKSRPGMLLETCKGIMHIANENMFQGAVTKVCKFNETLKI